MLALGFTLHKLSRGFHALHFSQEIPEVYFKGLTKVWLASKTIQIMSKNYGIIQRGHTSSLEPRKNISQVWIEDSWQSWKGVDFSQ